MAWRRVLGFVSLVLLLSGGAAWGDVWNVTQGWGPYSTIQAAVNAAKVGDVLVVEPGTYSPGTILWGNAVVIRGEPGAAIDGGEVPGTALLWESALTAYVDHCGVFLDSSDSLLTGLAFRRLWDHRVFGPDDAAVGIGILVFGASRATILSNEFEANEWGTAIGYTTGTLIALNNYAGNGVGVYGFDYQDAQIHLNSFEGNEYGVLMRHDFGPSSIIDATVNWWGDPDGPTHVSNLGGEGDQVSDNVVYSPWLGVNPDVDPLSPGVQLGSPVLLIVDDMGPAPELAVIEVSADLGLPFSGSIVLPGGYLNRAIGASNILPGLDTVEVRHGTYGATEPITDPVNIVSEVGSAAHTTLNGPIAIDVPDVLLGRLRQGFSIHGPITVGVGVDASTIHINWNDIYGLVTNGGLETLDATFNYWGEDGPDTVGAVNVFPLLPETSDTIIGYMDEHRLEPLQAIDFSYLLEALGREARALVGLDLMETFGFSLGGALRVMDEYGWMAVRRALSRAGRDYDDFMIQLVGYGIGGPAGGGGSFLGGGAEGTTGMSRYCVGCTVPLLLELIHPITGDVVDDACVSFSFCRTLEDGTVEIALFGVVPFHGDLGAYAFDVETEGLEPGLYDIYLGTDDGRNQHFQIEIF